MSTQNFFSGLFIVNPQSGVSRFRIYLLRFYYVIVMLILGSEVWPEIFSHTGSWKPMSAVAFSIWGTFSLLAIVGLIHPVKMIPLILVNFTYKFIWLSIVAFPLWSRGELQGSDAEELTRANSIGIVIDLVVIPWSFVVKNYLTPKRRAVAL